MIQQTCHDKIYHHLLHSHKTSESSMFQNLCFIYGVSSPQHKCYSAERMNKEASSVPNSMPFRCYSSAHKERHFFGQVSQFLHLCLLSHGQPHVRNRRSGVLFPKLGSSPYTIPIHFRCYIHFLWLIFFIAEPFA